MITRKEVSRIPPTKLQPWKPPLGDGVEEEEWQFIATQLLGGEVGERELLLLLGVARDELVVEEMLDVVDASLTTVSALMDLAEVLVGWSTGFSMAWTFSSGFESGPFATGSPAKQAERNATRRKETFILVTDWNLKWWTKVKTEHIKCSLDRNPIYWH